MMQFLKINRKKIIIVSIIILIIALLIFLITIIVIFLGDGLKENIIDKKAMEYESKEKHNPLRNVDSRHHHAAFGHYTASSSQ